MDLNSKEMFMDQIEALELSDLTASEKAGAYLSLMLRVMLNESGLPASKIAERGRIKNVHARIALSPGIERHRQPETNHRVTMAFTAPEPKPEPVQLEPEKKKSFISKVKTILRI